MLHDRIHSFGGNGERPRAAHLFELLMLRDAPAHKAIALVESLPHIGIVLEPRRHARLLADLATEFAGLWMGRAGTALDTARHVVAATLAIERIVGYHLRSREFTTYIAEIGQDVLGGLRPPRRVFSLGGEYALAHAIACFWKYSFGLDSSGKHAGYRLACVLARVASCRPVDDGSPSSRQSRLEWLRDFLDAQAVAEQTLAFDMRLTPEERLRVDGARGSVVFDVTAPTGRLRSPAPPPSSARR